MGEQKRRDEPAVPTQRVKDEQGWGDDELQTMAFDEAIIDPKTRESCGLRGAFVPPEGLVLVSEETGHRFRLTLRQLAAVNNFVLTRSMAA